MPASKITIVPQVEGVQQWLGVSQRSEPDFDTFLQPMIWMPRELDNSTASMLVVRDDRFGPLDGKLIHTSFGKGWIYYHMQEEVDGVTQAAVVAMPFLFDSRRPAPAGESGRRAALRRRVDRLGRRVDRTRREPDARAIHRRTGPPTHPDACAQRRRTTRVHVRARPGDGRHGNRLQRRTLELPVVGRLRLGPLLGRETGRDR